MWTFLPLELGLRSAHSVGLSAGSGPYTAHAKEEVGTLFFLATKATEANLDFATHHFPIVQTIVTNFSANVFE